MNRVVITGMGVVAPNGVGLNAFRDAIRKGISGIRFFQRLKDLGFSCCIGGIPDIDEETKLKYFSLLQLRGFNSSGILYGCMAGNDAWQDAGLEANQEVPDYDSGTVFGAGSSGIDKFKDSIYLLDDGKVRRLGSTVVSQVMSSGVSAYLGGMIGFGNQVTTNSSACTTGTEALLMGFERIQLGKAKRMLVGSCSDDGPYIWGGFDAMRVLTYKGNDQPEAASRPMSATASGFVPGGGAGALVLESLDSAKARGAKIYAEVLGGAINAGGQREGGSMTAPNPDAVQRCIKDAVKNSSIDPNEIDMINGHLTATVKDPLEIENWSAALGRYGHDFPYINSLKSMIGHCLAGAGSIECVSTVLQLSEQFIFPSINCEDPHPDILKTIPKEKIPQDCLELPIQTAAKASFGFGDVNACIIFKSFSD